jgi:hypothetical protein
MLSITSRVLENYDTHTEIDILSINKQFDEISSISQKQSKACVDTFLDSMKAFIL